MQGPITGLSPGGGKTAQTLRAKFEDDIVHFILVLKNLNLRLTFLLTFVAHFTSKLAFPAHGRVRLVLTTPSLFCFFRTTS